MTESLRAALSIRNSKLWLGLITAVFLVICFIPIPETFHGIANYLPLHTGMEVISISICVLIFAIGWHKPREIASLNGLLLSCAFLAIAILDFSHMISFSGMPDFVTPSGPGKAIYFWFAARSIAAIALLAVAIIPWTIAISRLQSWMMLFATFAIIFSFHVLVLYQSNSLPVMFIDGVGLTPIKITFEYILVGIYGLTAFLLLRNLKNPELSSFNLFAAVCIMAYGEYMLTLYDEVTDIYNLFGHIFKLLSYGFLYRVLFVKGIEQPYDRLEEAGNQLSATLHTLPDLLFEIDEQERYIQIFSNNPSKLIAPIEHLLGRKLSEFMPEKAMQTIREGMQEAKRDGTSRGKQIRLEVPEGVRWFELSFSRKPLLHRPDYHYVVISHDITERKSQENQVRQLSQSVSGNPFPIIITDSLSKIVYVNEAFEKATGYSSQEVMGKDPKILSAGKTPDSTYKDMWDHLSKGLPWRGELVNRHKNGKEFIDNTLIYPLVDERGVTTHYIAHKEDISEKKATADYLDRLNYYDPLTSLPNRRLLTKRFEEYLVNQQKSMALIWFDIDGFKRINDLHGHNVGDQIIIEAGKRLSESANTLAVISHSSGDDFLILIPTSRKLTPEKVAQFILSMMEQPFVIGEHHLSITVTLGVALYPVDGISLDQLIDRAEAAMFQAKEQGGNSYCFFDQELQKQHLESLRITHDLRRAITNNELRLVYQPQSSISDQSVVGAEALIRWHHPELGNISPDRFIPLAESAGLMDAIDEWVLEHVTSQIGQWKKAGKKTVKISLNLSANRFTDANLSKRILALLSQYDLEPSQIELELTEVAAMNNPDQAAISMRELNKNGISVSVDDFGTGYSSLSYLKQFSAYKLKIDQSFIREIATNKDDQIIVSTMTNMAHTMGMLVIVEGVETQAQLDFLRRIQCDQIQGYFFSKPLEVADFENFLSEHH